MSATAEKIILKSNERTQTKVSRTTGNEEERAQNSNRPQSQGKESYTPWSPSVSLPPERRFGTRDSPVHSQQQQQAQQQHQRHQAQVPRIRSRNGTMSGLGLHTFDPASFEHSLEQLISHQPDQNHRQYSSALINPPPPPSYDLASPNTFAQSRRARPFPVQPRRSIPSRIPGSLHTHSMSVGSSPVLFVPLTSLFSLCSDTVQPFPLPHSSPGLFQVR